jgi:hypothetical protein
VGPVRQRESEGEMKRAGAFSAHAGEMEAQWALACGRPRREGGKRGGEGELGQKMEGEKQTGPRTEGGKTDFG